MSNVVPLHKKPPGYKIVSRATDADLYLYGPIGGDFFGGGITAKQVADDLKSLGKVQNINVRINSEGGDVFDGKAIYSLLVDHKANINVKIDGLAASAASYIAMAGNTIEIAEGGFVMIHDAYGVSFGGAEDMRAYANLLDTVNATIREVYSARTGKPDAEIAALMRAETWFTAKDALSHKFVDRVTGNLKVAASVADPSRYKHLPAALMPRRSAAVARLAELKRK